MIGGAVATNFQVKKSLSVSGYIQINSNGTLYLDKSSITLTGNWINNGSFTEDPSTTTVYFAGTSQTISGTSVTTFQRLTINSGSSVTLAQDINVTGSAGSKLDIFGTFNPGSSPSYLVTADEIELEDNAVLHVKASAFSSNYNVAALTLRNLSIVNYSSTVTNQVVSNAYIYSTLYISGSGVKSLNGNLPSLLSNNAARGNIFITGGTFDLQGYTANRGNSTTGGTISISNGATLKIGGTNTFPANFNTKSLTINSNVEYNGANQPVLATTYGNLSLSASSGSVVKTFPGSAFTVTGNFTASIGSGTALSFTAASDFSVNGSATLGNAVTFNGNSYSHTFSGNWINNGVFNGNTSTCNFNGAGSDLSGSGTNTFNNINFSANGITASGSTDIIITGNIATLTGGGITHQPGGTSTMSGSGKTISGTGIIFNNLTITGTISSSASFTIAGNLGVSGSITATGSSIITLSGSTKTISGPGTITFRTLRPSGSISADNNFNIEVLLDVTGDVTATAGTVTFKSSSAVTGTANLYNVEINGTQLTINSNSILGIANTLTLTSGTLNVSANTTNTVNFNGSGAQNINAITFHHLQVSNGNTKTTAGAVTVNGNLTINSSTTLNGSTYTHYIYGNWVNNSGTFTGSGGTIEFAGNSNSTITGVTTFNNITVNKSGSSKVQVSGNTNVSTVNMTAGSAETDAAAVLNITVTRTGSGVILGNIKRTHSFTSGVAYAFESPNNTVTFSAANSVTDITMTVTVGSVSGFSTAVNRTYSITSNGSFGAASATLRLHYEDAELNGNTESQLDLWENNGSSWGYIGQTARDATNNYVEYNGILSTILNSPWAVSYIAKIVSWNGSVSTDWNNASNWTVVQGSPGTPPGSTDVVLIGYTAFANNPLISSSVTINNLVFQSAQAATLTIGAGGSLSVNGNLLGSWAADATHSIAVGTNTMTVNGDIILGNGTANRRIDMTLSSGTLTIAGSIIQASSSNLSVTSSGTITIGAGYEYITGVF
ncbi:MAG: hypothetical protein HC867_10375, partial [Bacteroidia bacterium]|nr:hypothetical protein [Bacteroidia bacterium]